MGMITCDVNSNLTLTVISITGQNPRHTWASFKDPSFQVSGDAGFDLALEVPDAAIAFRFDPSDPIDWGTNGQPSWITIEPGTTSTTLTLQIDSAAAGQSSFTVRNTATNGQPLPVTVQSLGGSGGTGGTIVAYVRDDQRVLIGQMPPGLEAAGNEMRFGFKDSGENELTFQGVGTVELSGFEWTTPPPGNIGVTATASQQVFLIDNPNSMRQESEFTLDTTLGSIQDPTIVTNPDESAP